MVLPGGADDGGLELNRMDRVRWIEKNLVRPTRKIIDALAHENDRFLSEWPYKRAEWIDAPLPPPPSWRPSLIKKGNKIQFSGPSLRELGHLGTYRKVWLSELDRLLKWAQAKKEVVSRRALGSRKPRTNLRHELVFDLLLIYVTLFPSRRPTRVSHGKKPRASAIQSDFSEFVRVAAAPVLGTYENLDHQIQKAIERHRTEKTELWMRVHFFI
jgi:hypothetical protein